MYALRTHFYYLIVIIDTRVYTNLYTLATQLEIENMSKSKDAQKI